VKKLHKLLYYCQGHHLAVHGEPLFAETLEAWDMGPVVAELWRAEKPGPVRGDTSQLGEAELNTVAYTVYRYGTNTGMDLERLSHTEPPWQEANRNRRPGGAVPLDRKVMVEFFKTNGGVPDETAPNWPAIHRMLREAAERPIEHGKPLNRREMSAALAEVRVDLGG
jgi:uncharacterized phage-associated protein